MIREARRGRGQQGGVKSYKGVVGRTADNKAKGHETWASRQHLGLESETKQESNEEEKDSRIMVEENDIRMVNWEAHHQMNSSSSPRMAT